MSIAISKKWWVVLGVVVILAAGIIICVNTMPIIALSEESVIKQFNLLHYESGLWARATWMGIRTMQNPCDMWTMQEIISRVRPDFIVETGTANGGSSLFFAMVLAQVSDRGRVITVDIDPKIEGASKYQIFRERVEVIKGDSVSDEVINRIAALVKGHTVLVTLDSLHTKDHVLNGSSVAFCGGTRLIRPDRGAEPVIM